MSRTVTEAPVVAARGRGRDGRGVAPGPGIATRSCTAEHRDPTQVPLPSGEPDNNEDPNDNDENADDPNDLANAIFAGVMQGLSQALHLQGLYHRPKANKPETFNGSNSHKLNSFITQYIMYFSNYADSYKSNLQKISFAIMFICSSALM